MTNTMYPTGENTKIWFIIIRNLDELIFYRMKGIQDKQQGLRMRLRNNQRELQRLMTDFENFGAVVVTGSEVTGMENWLLQSRPRRHAPAVQSPDPLDNTQTTDASTQPTQSTLGDSQISDAASEALAAGTFSDDYTGSSEDDEDEDRSVDTETGLADSSASDSSYLTRSQKKKRKRRKAKKASKKSKKSHKKAEDRKREGSGKSRPRSPSY